jgi:hypothetical protein
MTDALIRSEANVDPLKRRLCVVIAFIVSIAVILVCAPMIAFGLIQQNSWLFVPAFIPAFPAMFVIVMSLLNLQAFPLDYGCFGLKERTKFPATWPRQATLHTSIRVGTLYINVPTPLWLHREGVGVRIPLYGEAFIPLATISRLEWDAWHVHILHTSCEIRSPFVVFVPFWARRKMLEDLESWLQVAPDQRIEAGNTK